MRVVQADQRVRAPDRQVPAVGRQRERNARGRVRVQAVEGFQRRVPRDRHGAVASRQEEVSRWDGVVECALVCLEGLGARWAGGWGWQEGDWDEYVVL